MLISEAEKNCNLHICVTKFNLFILIGNVNESDKRYNSHIGVNKLGLFFSKSIIICTLLSSGG